MEGRVTHKKVVPLHFATHNDLHIDRTAAFSILDMWIAVDIVLMLRI
jgi:hypothetical protein